MTQGLDNIGSVLVTGGGGFIGSHLADRLVDVCEVVVYDNFSTGQRSHVPADATIIEANLRDPDRLTEAISDVDVVFHEAAQVSVQRSIESPVGSKEVNLDPILTVLEAARQTDTRVVFASSAAIYGHPHTLPIDESHPKEPTSPYGLEKLTADQYCRLYHELYGVETVVLRYFNAYGPRQHDSDYSGVISVFQRQARAGDEITVDGDGTQTRDFVHVEDIVQANLRAATSNTAVGEAFNIGTGESISIRELAETIRELTSSDADIIHTDPRDGDIDQSRADITKARSKLGFEPHYTIEDGLRQYLCS
ncbi:NAD-dependent epimerase/dehydratase family protein [Halorubrum ezzemoulense]|uniref:NAD-dependent epimerase/dehydratase family protein n=1 Tax=Halorubrum ezzemoulense TaxID=337243 RepID=UPI00232AB472|nr:NAD-dependent epimerase/dehydratase family protein [Halorubrum ezzemoulense]MDB9252921.1 NAD-dependent epimerase/dehydratase family protein [Halorubrum ezzemoulense]MDB9256695.1 NAD-dependent epimerase/dehydratase family protein [Halorubrum ezzemoulense]MDB9277002.1 NAD-dependent epimerase/dehydratase family protein [Halorubrum ezzemoulense]